jgi:AcrR family transcriptional regulator
MRATATRDDIDDLILDAVDRLLASRGYKKMTIDELAGEVGIGKGTVYLHFRSKEDLALSHVDRIVYRLLVKLQTIAHNDAPAPDRLRQMLVTRVLHRFDSVQHYTASIADLLAAIRPALLERRERHFALEQRVFADVLEAGRAAGEFEIDDPAAVARTLVVATNALLPFSLSATELGRRKDVEREVLGIADLALVGILPRSESAKRTNKRPVPKR